VTRPGASASTATNWAVASRTPSAPAFGAGLGEYEWSWVIDRDAVPAVIAALDGREGDDPLQVLTAWSAAHRGADAGSHLRDVGVPIEFRSQIGE
jgi:hypothetical protein